MNEKTKDTIKLLNDEYVNTLVQKETLEMKAKTQMMTLDKTELYNNALKVEGLKKYLDFLKQTISSYGEYVINNALSINDIDTEIYVYYNLYKYSVKEICLLKSYDEPFVLEIIDRLKS